MTYQSREIDTSGLIMFFQVPQRSTWNTFRCCHCSKRFFAVTGSWWKAFDLFVVGWGAVCEEDIAVYMIGWLYGGGGWLICFCGILSEGLLGLTFCPSVVWGKSYARYKWSGRTLCGSVVGGFDRDVRHWFILQLGFSAGSAVGCRTDCFDRRMEHMCTAGCTDDVTVYAFCG